MAFSPSRTRTVNHSTANMTANGASFLSFNKPPRVFITTPSQHPPERTFLGLQEEGFSVSHLPFNPSNPQLFISTLKSLHNELNVGESFALLAYSSAATVALQVAQKPVAKLCALIAYYPTVLPNPSHKFPSLLKIVVHVAGLSQISAPAEACEWKCYRYERARTGFAEEGTSEFEHVEAGLAWTRTLTVLRAAFNQSVGLEEIVDRSWRGKYDTEDPEKGSVIAVRSMTSASPHVTILPTLEGGLGRKALEQFYREFFIPSLLEDFETRLVSRTIGIDRVVDEMVISFTHTDDVDWMLPGVPPTGKFVEVPVVSIVAVRGGKLVSEHMYWDQASVLVQMGLLDPNMVPKKLRNEGLKKLPVAGAEAAKQLVEPRQDKYNALLKEHGLMDGLDDVNDVNGA